MSDTNLSMKIIRSIVLCLQILAIVVCSNLHAEKVLYKVLALKNVDQKFLDLGYQRINDLAKQTYGSSFRHSATHDIELLQRMLDTKVVSASDRQLLQDMGIVLGEVFRREFNLNWVLYSDRLGQSRALRYDRSENFIFPITMISRRAETGLSVDVAALYNKIKNQILSYRGF